MQLPCKHPVAQMAISHVAPVQPLSHVHVSGAVQLPLTHGLEQTGVVQLESVHPALHWQIPGTEHHAELRRHPVLQTGVLQVEPVHPVRQALHKSPPQFPVQIHSLGKVQKPFRQPGLHGALHRAGLRINTFMPPLPDIDVVKFVLLASA